MLNNVLVSLKKYKNIYKESLEVQESKSDKFELQHTWGYVCLTSPCFQGIMSCICKSIKNKVKEA